MEQFNPDYSFRGNHGVLPSMIEGCAIRIKTYNNQIKYLLEKIKNEEAQLQRYKEQLNEQHDHQHHQNLQV